MCLIRWLRPARNRVLVWVGSLVPVLILLSSTPRRGQVEMLNSPGQGRTGSGPSFIVNGCSMPDLLRTRISVVLMTWRSLLVWKRRSVWRLTWYLLCRGPRHRVYAQFLETRLALVQSWAIRRFYPRPRLLQCHPASVVCIQPYTAVLRYTECSARLL